MTIHLNGAPREVAEEATVASVLALLEVSTASRGVAVAVDREVLPRGRWEQTRLRAGARLEVLSATQGG